MAEAKALNEKNPRAAASRAGIFRAWCAVKIGMNSRIFFSHWWIRNCFMTALAVILSLGNTLAIVVPWLAYFLVEGLAFTTMAAAACCQIVMSEGALPA